MSKDYEQHEPKRWGVEFLHGAVKTAVPKGKKHVHAHAKERHEDNYAEPEQREFVFFWAKVLPADAPKFAPPVGAVAKGERRAKHSEQAKGKGFAKPDQAGDDFMIPIHAASFGFRLA